VIRPDDRAARPARRPARRARRVLAGAAVVALASGCGVPRFGFPDTLATEQAHRTLTIWQGSCIAALSVGVFVWAIILWAPFRYRRRSDELPKQVRYNLPIEVLYTLVPFVIIAALFYYTARDENYLNRLMPQQEFAAKNGVTVDVIGYQWNWKFEYPQSGVAIAGSQYNEPTLYLPKGRPVRFIESSVDVIHSFWVIDFAFKRDVIPGRVNQFEVTPDRTGTYVGRCAELCGYQHDRMNFQAVVLESADFDRKIAELKAAGPSTLTGPNVSTSGGNSNDPNGVGSRDPNSGTGPTGGYVTGPNPGRNP